MHSSDRTNDATWYALHSGAGRTGPTAVQLAPGTSRVPVRGSASTSAGSIRIAKVYTLTKSINSQCGLPAMELHPILECVYVLDGSSAADVVLHATTVVRGADESRLTRCFPFKCILLRSARTLRNLPRSVAPPRLLAKVRHALLDQTLTHKGRRRPMYVRRIDEKEQEEEKGATGVDSAVEGPFGRQVAQVRSLC